MKDLTDDTFKLIFTEGKTFDISCAIIKEEDAEKREFSINLARERAMERLGSKLMEELMANKDKIVSVKVKENIQSSLTTRIERLHMTFRTFYLKEELEPK